MEGFFFHRNSERLGTTEGLGDSSIFVFFGDGKKHFTTNGVEWSGVLKTSEQTIWGRKRVCIHTHTSTSCFF